MAIIKSFSFSVEDIRNLTMARNLRPKMGQSSLLGLIIREWLDSQNNAILTPTEMRELCERMVKALSRLE